MPRKTEADIIREERGSNGRLKYTCVITDEKLNDIQVTTYELLMLINRMNEVFGVDEYIAIKGFNQQYELICVVKTSKCEFDYNINLGILETFIKDKNSLTEVIYNTIGKIRELEKEHINKE